MISLEQLAEAALQGDSLLLRSLTQDWLRENPSLNECQPPRINDPRILAVAAALIELFAQRLHQSPPDWTEQVEALPEPIYLLKSARTMKRLREMCEADAPPPRIVCPREFPGVCINLNRYHRYSNSSALNVNLIVF